MASPAREDSEEGSSKPPLLKRDGDAAAEPGGDDEEHRRADEHRLAMGDREATEASKQDGPLNTLCYR